MLYRRRGYGVVDDGCLVLRIARSIQIPQDLVWMCNVMFLINSVGASTWTCVHRPALQSFYNYDCFINPTFVVILIRCLLLNDDTCKLLQFFNRVSFSFLFFTCFSTLVCFHKNRLSHNLFIQLLDLPVNIITTLYTS